MSTIHFIGGEKGGVGKSVVARLLTQYCIDREVPFAAVDADGSHGTLIRHYGDFTRAVDLDRFESADEIVGLATEGDRRVVVDLPAQSTRALGNWMRDTDITTMAHECGIHVVFWHVMDDGKDSLVALDRLLARHGNAVKYCVVRNRGRGRDFSLFDTSPTRARVLALRGAVIDIPELHGVAMQKIDRFDASFWAAGNNPTFGGDVFTMMDRQRIRTWLKTAFAQIAELGDAL